MKKKLKKLPVLLTDEQAERFVDTADLSEYDLSGFKKVHFRFEFEPKSRAISVRLPENLYATVQKKAAAEGIQTQRYIRRALEEAIAR